MKCILLIIISISILAFTPNEKKAEYEIMEIMKEVKNKNFELDNFESTLKESYCSEILFKTEKGLECKLVKSLSKDFKAKRIHVTTEPARLNTRSISLIFLGYGKKNEKAKTKLEDDFEILANELEKAFSLVQEINNEKGEAVEKAERVYTNKYGTTIQILKLFGGCFNDKRIIISIFKE